MGIFVDFLVGIGLKLRVEGLWLSLVLGSTILRLMIEPDRNPA